MAVVAAGVACAIACSAARVGAQGCGDPDGNGVDVIDAANVLRAAVALPSSCTGAPQLCDVDGVGGITVVDAASVLRRAVGLPGANACGGSPTPTPTSGTPAPTPTTTPGCGNGKIDPGEDCEGTLDLCAPNPCFNCQCPLGPDCGDDFLDEDQGEGCDGEDADFCPGTCTSFCQCPVVGVCLPNARLCNGGAQSGEPCAAADPDCPGGTCDPVQCTRNTDCGFNGDDEPRCCDRLTCSCKDLCPFN
jgi:hypothetical protein